MRSRTWLIRLFRSPRVVAQERDPRAGRLLAAQHAHPSLPLVRWGAHVAVRPLRAVAADAGSKEVGRGAAAAHGRRIRDALEVVFAGADLQCSGG